jgi:hypothetical protein
MKTGLIIGGTGRQGEAIVQFLSSTNQYHLLILTRNTTSDSALKLAAHPKVELVPNNTVNGYDVESFLSVTSKSELVFINTDGFTLGELAEIYWGIRLFELARKAGVKHLIYSGLGYNGEETGFDPKFYVGYYEGKARVQSKCLTRCTPLHTNGRLSIEFIHAHATERMALTIIRSGLYIENLSQFMAPTIDIDGAYLFKLPLDNGALPFI